MRGACVLIDGRSGSGKTELARAMVTDWKGAQLVRLDDLYPGWDGLATGSAAVPTILSTHHWRAWDWATNRPGDRHELDPTRPIVVEGVGAISVASVPFADYAIWVELDPETRKVRALDRDGDAYAPYWDRWAAQEVDFIERENPQALADEVIDGHDLTNAVPRLLQLLGRTVEQ